MMPSTDLYDIIIVYTGALLGYNLTDANGMKSQYDNLYSSNLNDLANYVSLLYLTISKN